MMRAHRKAHLLIWPVIAIVVGALFVAALALRPAKADEVGYVGWVKQSATQHIHGNRVGLLGRGPRDTRALTQPTPVPSAPEALP